MPLHGGWRDTSGLVCAYGGAVVEEGPVDLRNLSSVFFAIHLAGGHIGLPILVSTFIFSKTVKRPSAVINFCVIWIFYSIIYCLLIYGGDSVMNDPPYGLCLTQAAMNYAASPMAVVAGFQVVLQIWCTFHDSPWKESRLAAIPHWIKMAAIIMPPYLTFVGFAIPAGYMGWTNPQLVQVKTGLFCGLMHGRFQKFAVPIFCSIFLILIIGFEVGIVVRICRGRRLIKRHFPLANPRKPSLSPACRATLFLVYAALGLGVCITDMKRGTVAGYMIQASLPLAAFLIFGSQKDVILLCLHWKSRRKWEPENPGDNDRESGDSHTHRVTRPLSFISATTIDSTTPIATRPSDSVV